MEEEEKEEGKGTLTPTAPAICSSVTCGGGRTASPRARIPPWVCPSPCVCAGSCASPPSEDAKEAEEEEEDEADDDAKPRRALEAEGASEDADAMTIDAPVAPDADARRCFDEEWALGWTLGMAFGCGCDSNARARAHCACPCSVPLVGRLAADESECGAMHG